MSAAFSFFNSRQALQTTLNTLTQVGFLLTAAALVKGVDSGATDSWLMPANWNRPPELEGVDINENPCLVFCYIESYLEGIKTLYNENHPVYGKMAADMLAYCSEGIAQAAAAGIKGMEACLPGVSKEAVEEFTGRVFTRSMGCGH